MSAIQELKTRTTDLHERIEKVVPLLDPALTMADYMEYLERLIPFYQPVEECLRSIPSLRAAVPDLDERWKTGLLEMDLGHSARHGSVSAARSFAPEPRNLAEALGCLYVLEGSTLGAQILIRAVQKSLGRAAIGKTNFLQSYGSGVGDKWRKLCDALNAVLAGPQDVETAVEAARATFAGLHNWLVYSTDEMPKVLGAR